MGNYLNSRFLAAVLYFAAYMAITGCLHIDGLGDTFDGIFSNKSKEKMLEIMRDSRAGIMGLSAILIVTLIDIASTEGIVNVYALFFCPVWEG